MNRPTTRLTPLCALTLLLATLTAPPPAGAEEASAVPTFAEVAGHAFGERITVHAEMRRYLEALGESSPRVEIVDQGASSQGRRLLVAIVTSEENHARLDRIQQNAWKLADPRQLNPFDIDATVTDQPVVVWLGGSIHGNELSGSEGLLKVLERLTTRDDEATRKVLENAVVLIDPMLNPDGRDSFATYNHERLGQTPSPRREDWNNDNLRWESYRFRTGHYFFDTNRDWFAHTQPETRHRVETLRRWRPQVVIDAHEMGPDQEFYFDPPMAPYAVFFPDFAKTWFERFNESYAAAFDAQGFEYTTRELFNYYFPGYTTSYNSYQGAVGMLYEQGSSRGLAYERKDESVRTLEDALEQQATAAWAAITTSARERETLLREYHAALRAAVDSGREGVRRYIVPAGGPEGSDPVRVRELVELLRRNAIEVEVLEEEARLEGLQDLFGGDVKARSFPAGTYLVETAQPQNALLKTLLEGDLPLPEDFLAEARARLDRGENPRFYDITAWSLPLLFDVETLRSTDGRPLDTGLLMDPPTAPAPGEEKASYAYLVDGRSAASMGVLYHLADRGYRATMSTAPTRVGGEIVPSGTVVVRVGQNDDGVHAVVRELAGRYGVGVRAVSTGLGDGQSPALGSAESIPVKKSAIALVAEQPVDGYSFGWTWYTLDRHYEIPVTVLRAGSLAATPLHAFQTIVLPDLQSAEEMAAVLGEAGRDALARFVRDGGTLVAIGDAVGFVREHLELTSLLSWYEENKVGEGEDAREARRFSVPGAILRAELDPEIWLTAGYVSTELPFLVDSDRLVLPPDGPPSSSQRVAARVAAEGDPRLAGHLWPESLERLPGIVLAYDERVGRGRVIAFPEDPSYRAFFRGADRLFLNAIVLGPTAP